MKKKFSVLLLVLFALTGVTIAQDITMPTDEEIMAVLDKYEFTKEQKEYLLKETKKTIQEGINSGEFQKIMSQVENEPQDKTIYKGSLIDLKKE